MENKQYSSPNSTADAFIDPETIHIGYELLKSNNRVGRTFTDYDHHISHRIQLITDNRAVAQLMKALSYSGDGYLYFIIGAMFLYAD